MLRNLASSLILTERDAEYDTNAPKVKGRVVTTLHKAKEVRPLVEKCITIARHSLKHESAASEFATNAERNSDAWKTWRGSDKWQQWNQAIAPAIAARRRALKLLGDKEAVSVLFDVVGPRFEDRQGGYTRIVRLATTRLGDAGVQAVLEFVGVRDRVIERSEKPAFDDDQDEIEDSADADDEDEDDSEEVSAEAEEGAGDDEEGEEKT